MTEQDLPTLSDLLDKNSFRLQGISGWEDLSHLGTGNLRNILELVKGNGYRMLMEHPQKSEVALFRQGMQQLEHYLKQSSELKPFLPRLRMESFRHAEEVMVYLGDTQGITSKESWMQGIIIGVEKSYKQEFAATSGSSKNGYYWRLTAQLNEENLPWGNTVSFSTSEPRVIPAKEFTYLKKALTEDPCFLEIYCKNARRDWEPIWCTENSLKSSGLEMDMQTWLKKQ